jgi:prevent-host-death family protein
MDTVGSYEAKTHLPKLLERVANGETITITKHGVAVAMLVPAGERQKRDPKKVIREIKLLRKGRTLGGISIRELIEEGRRY